MSFILLTQDSRLAYKSITINQQVSFMLIELFYASIWWKKFKQFNALNLLLACIYSTFQLNVCYVPVALRMILITISVLS